MRLSWDFMGNSRLPFNIKLSTNTDFAIIICYSELLSAVLPVAGNDPLWCLSSQANVTACLPEIKW